MRLFYNKNNNDGLPDLDELFRKWAKRLASGSKKNGDSPQRNGGGDNGGKEGIALPPPSLMALLAGTLVCVVYVLAGFFTVDANERVVMFRLGNPIGVRGPGLKWHMPLIEDYRIVNVSEIRRVEVGYRNDTKNKNLRESLMLTSDLNIIDMQFVVQYALNNAELFLFENRFANLRAEDVVQQVAETSMREVVGRSGIDFVLYEGREAIADESRALMRDIMDYYQTGIDIQQVAIQNVQPPDQVQDAFEDAIKARQDRERKINEGQAYANDILPRAQGQASRIRKEAEAYKESSIIRAEGESQRFLSLASEFVEAPEVTRRRLYLETMENVFARANKVIIDDDTGNNLLYLPLDQLKGAAAGSLPAFYNNPPRTGTSDNSPNSAATGNTLDNLKNYLKQQQQRLNAVEELEARR